MKRELLHRFFAGTASLSEEREVCDWAEADAQNRKELIRERKQFDILLLHQAVGGQKRAASSYRIPSVVKDWLKVAATIAILVVSSLHLYDWLQPEKEIALNKIVVPPGQRVNLTLSDGTDVWLNARTELTYPASFDGTSRRVTLKGEGYFEVAKEAERPFIVQTSKYDIEVLGTSFNVEAYDNTDLFSAALLEGSIQLSDKTKPEAKVMLKPSQKAELRNGQFTIGTITEYDSFRWKEGLICVDDMLFADLMKIFEKTYDIRIVIQTQKLDKYTCGGKFRITDGVDFVLQILQRNAKFTFSRSDDNTTIYIR